MRAADSLSQLNDSRATVLITGAGGMLGRAFAEVLAAGAPDARVLALARERLDVTDRGAVLALAAQKPAWIVHCAADVNAERCETQPDETRRVQVGGTENIAELAERTGARVLYPQSFLVFDGSQLPIDEDTPPNPGSVYATCKLEAERLLIDRLGERALAIRMAGFFGGEEKDKNFVGKFVAHVRKLLDAGTHSYAVGDRVWQPTWTVDLARNSALLMDRQRSGLYTLSCDGEASFCELARACVGELGLAAVFTVEATSESAVAAAELVKRPPRAVMERRRLKAEGLDRMRPWREALAEYLHRPHFQNLFAAYRTAA